MQVGANFSVFKCSNAEAAARVLFRFVVVNGVAGKVNKQASEVIKKEFLLRRRSREEARVHPRGKRWGMNTPIF